MFSSVNFPCSGSAGQHRHNTYAVVCTDCQHCASSAGMFAQTLGSATAGVFSRFPGKDFYKKYTQREGGSRCRLALHTPLQLPAYGGRLKKKKRIWMVWKSIHPVSQRINYFFLVICCVLSWLHPPVLLWRNALESQAVQIRTTLCADFLHDRGWRFSFNHFFVRTIISDCARTFDERNPSPIYGNKRTENPT